MKTKSISIMFAMFLLTGCATNKIVNYSYDDNVRGYRVYFKSNIMSPDKSSAVNNLIMRDRDGKKITDKNAVDSVVQKYNKNNYPVNEYLENRVSETKKYNASKGYYEGIRLQSELKFKEAIDSYKKALELNKFLLYYSDIYFRLGQCYEGVKEKDNAEESYNRFLLYSEETIPKSFYQIYNSTANMKNLLVLTDSKIALIEKGESDNNYFIAPNSAYEILKIARPQMYPALLSRE